MTTRRKADASDLTEKDRVTLRHVLAHRTSKEIALILGESPHTVDARLKRIMRRVDAPSRVEAARLLLGERGDEYQPLVCQSPDLRGGSATGQDGEASGISGLGLPFPTPKQPINRQPIMARLFWPIQIAMASIAGVALLRGILLGLNSFFE